MRVSYEQPIFDFRFIKFVFRISGAQNFEILLRTPILVVLVPLPLEWNTYLLFNSDIVNFVWKTDQAEEGSIVLLLFVLWQCFNCLWMRGCGVGQKILFRAS